MGEVSIHLIRQDESDADAVAASEGRERGRETLMCPAPQIPT